MDISLWKLASLDQVPVGKPALFDGDVLIPLGRERAGYTDALVLSGQNLGNLVEIRNGHCLFFPGPIAFEVEESELLKRPPDTNAWSHVGLLMVFPQGAFVNAVDRQRNFHGVSAAGGRIDSNGLDCFHRAFIRWNLALIMPDGERTPLISVAARALR